jgi:hypothetical protein
MKKLLPILAAATASVLLFLAFAASAVADPVASGKASLKLDADLYRAMQREGIGVEKLSAAKVQGRVIGLPLRGGELAPGDGSGKLPQKGGVKFTVGGRAVALSGFVLDTEKDRLSAKLGGKKLTLATVKGVKSSREGFGVRVGIDNLELTARAARALNGGLGVRGVFRGGQPLAGASVGVRFSELTVTGATIYFFFDPAFRAKLESLGVEVLTFEATETYVHTLPGFAIPGVGGSLARDLSSGALVSPNGLRLVQGGGTPTGEVAMLGISLSFEGRSASADIRVQPAGTGGVAPIATVEFSTVHANPTTGVISTPETRATLSPNLADALNATFAAPRGQPSAFSAGEPFGTLAFVVNTR